MKVRHEIWETVFLDRLKDVFVGGRIGNCWRNKSTVQVRIDGCCTAIVSLIVVYYYYRTGSSFVLFWHQSDNKSINFIGHSS
jgi:hypothetical protein